MRPQRISKQFFFLCVFLIGVLCSCGNSQDAQKGAEEQAPAAEQKALGKALERISVSEMGKLRSRVGKEVIVSGKISGTSTSGSGHHFLNFSNGFKVVCLKDNVGRFGKGGPAEIFRGKLIEVQGTLASHQGKPQIAVESPAQIKSIELDKRGGSAAVPGQKFELIEVGQNTWVSPAGLRYVGRDAEGKTRKAHVLRHARNQPDRAGSHGVFDADGDEVFRVIDEAWAKIKKKNIDPRVEGDSQAYTVPMGRRVGYLGGKNGARRNKPSLKSVFIVVRRGSKDVVTAFPK